MTTGRCGAPQDFNVHAEGYYDECITVQLDEEEGEKRSLPAGP